MVEWKNRRISNWFLYRNGQIGPLNYPYRHPARTRCFFICYLLQARDDPKWEHRGISWHIVAFLQVWCSSGVHYTGGGGGGGCGAGLRWLVGSMDPTAWILACSSIGRLDGVQADSVFPDESTKSIKKQSLPFQDSYSPFYHSDAPFDHWPFQSPSLPVLSSILP